MEMINNWQKFPFYWFVFNFVKTDTGLAMAVLSWLFRRLG